MRLPLARRGGQAGAAPQVHHRTCNLCEAMCGLRLELQSDRVLSIGPDPDDPFSRGHICPKAPALKALQEDPDRLRTPMRRTRQGWEPVGWREALDETAQRLHGIQTRRGRDAVAIYVGNPVVHNLGALVFGPLLLKALGTRNRFSATSVDQLPAMLTAFRMFGHQLLLPIPDVDRTQHLLMLGANPVASNGSLMTAPGIRRRLQELLARGGALVVVDPRRTETAALASEHVQIRPTTDALFLLSLLHVVFDTSGAKLRHLAAFSDGLSRLQEVVARFPPERTAPHTEIDPATTRRLARELMGAERAVCYGRLGVSTQRFGTLCHWLISCLNAVTGNLDRVGGAMFTEPALDLLTMRAGFGVGRGSFGRWKSRVRGVPEFGGELPVATLSEEIETEGQGQIRGLLTIAGNPVLSTPNGRRLEQALDQLDFMVSVDLYLNETSRKANLILPVSTPLERSHYDAVFHAVAVRNTAKYSPAAFPRPDGVRHDWEIIVGLLERLHRLGGDRSRARRAAALRHLGPDRLVDLALRAGPHGLHWTPPRLGLSLSRLKREPHGVDLGPLRPCLRERMTQGARRDRVDLAPPEFIEDVRRLEESMSAAPASVRTDSSKLHAHLIGRRHVRSNNSWMHNLPKLTGGTNRCTLLMHPEDLRDLGGRNGQSVRVTSRVGEVVVEVEESGDVMRGVVSLPHGFGHDRDGTRMVHAEAIPGPSLNDLTDEADLDEASGNAVLSGLSVTIELA